MHCQHGFFDYFEKRRVARLLGFLLVLGSLFLTLNVRATSAILVVDSQLKNSPKFSATDKVLMKKGERVQIKKRERGWYQIERANKQKGWVTLLQVRFESKRKAQTSSGLSKIINLRKGHSNVTATTGVRGIGENDIKNAKANFSALHKAKRYKASELEAQKHANKVALQSQKIKYQGE